MSLLKTVVLEASSHSNSKSVFRIPSQDKLIMPELRLCNFGVVTGGSATGSEKFCYGQGVYSLIKAVRLYSNNVLIDQCQDCSRYMVLKNLAGSSSYIFDVKQKTLCSNVNMQDAYNDQGLTGFKLLTNKLLGRIDLSDCLPFLSSVVALYNMPGELRVEVEYNSDIPTIFSDDGNSADAAFVFNVNQPTLLYTQETDDKAISMAAKEMPSKFMWATWEREFVQGLGNNQVNVPRVRAFDNKFVDVLLIQKILNGAAHPKLGYGYSHALVGEKSNYVVNGSKQLLFSGHDSHAKASAQVADMLGDLVIPFNAWDNMAANADNIMVDDFATINGKLSWNAIQLSRVINRLDIEMSFTQPNAGDTCDLWVWGRVFKFAVKDDKGNWMVGYTS